MQNFFNRARVNLSPADQTRKQAIMASIMGQGVPAPTNVGSGIGQGMNSILAGMQMRKLGQGQFPDAPGGGKPNFMTGLMNMFGGGRGGLR